MEFSIEEPCPSYEVKYKEIVGFAMTYVKVWPDYKDSIQIRKSHEAFAIKVIDFLAEHGDIPQDD